MALFVSQRACEGREEWTRQLFSLPVTQITMCARERPIDFERLLRFMGRMRKAHFALAPSDEDAPLKTPLRKSTILRLAELTECALTFDDAELVDPMTMCCVAKVFFD